MKKILLFSDLLNIHLRKYPNCKICVSSIYTSAVPQWIIKVAKRSFVSNIGILYSDWKERIEQYDKVVITDSDINKGALNYLSKVAGNKTILYYWNKIESRELELYKEATKLGIKQATYNLHDAMEYKIEYIPQFWNGEYVKYAKQGDIKWDVIFCGRAKNRLDNILKIKQNIGGMRTNFWVVSDEKTEDTVKEGRPYSDYLHDVGSSAAILDVVGEDNWGLTWRPLEALFCKKKLITNYTDIVQYDFYEPYKNNIFIIKNGDCNGLKKFMQRKYDEVDLDLKKYDAQGWLDNIFKLN